MSVSIDFMKNEIMKKYGPTIRGQKVNNMHDYQVLAIYNRLLHSKTLEKKQEEYHQITLKEYGGLTC